MSVFEFVHLSYCWESNDCDLVRSEIFSTYEDAVMFYEIIRDKIVAEYLNEANVNDLKSFAEEDDDYNYYNESDYSKSEPELDANGESYTAHYYVGYPSFYISMDEYGSDTLMIKKKSVMKFSE